MPTENLRDIRDIAVFALLTFLGLRSMDVTFLRSSTIQFMKHLSVHVPRHYHIILDNTKNDKKGDGPVAGRTFMLVCTCVATIDARAVTVWNKKVKNDQINCKFMVSVSTVIDDSSFR